MSISIEDKKKVIKMAKPEPIVELRQAIRLRELIDYHLLACRL